MTVLSSLFSSANLLPLQFTAAGEMTNPSQPCFLVQPNANQNNIATGGVTVIFDTEVTDQGNDFTSNTFTAPVTGKYQLNVSLRVNTLDSAATNYAFRLITSNRTYEYIKDYKTTADQNWDLIQISVIADMDANDTAYVTITQTGGTVQTDITSASSFSGALIC
jgi:hypothetical protein